MADREPRTIRVDVDLWARFEERVEELESESHGSKPKHLEKALLEYLDEDREARIERKVDDLPEKIVDAVSEEILDRERKSGSSSNNSSNSNSSINQRTRDSLNAVVNEIPENTVISEALLESAIENNAGHAYKTLERYKSLLKNRGHILEHPVEEGQYVTSQKKFAIICENNDKITPPRLRDIIADRMERLGEEWYLDALPRDLMENNTDLKVDQVMDTEPYRRDHDLLDDRRGVQ